MLTLNIGPCKKRSRICEGIDRPDLDEDSLRQLYEFFGVINNRFGAYRIILNFLKECSAHWGSPRSISILDLYCGRGDLSAAIVRWARQTKTEVRILAVDPIPSTIKLARQYHSDLKEITFEGRDFHDSQFLHAQQFDYVVSSMTLHRFETDDNRAFLKRVNLLAKRGFIVSDWLRDLRAFFWMKFVVRLWEDEWIHRDGPLAIQRGFTPQEVQRLAVETGLDYAAVKSHFGYRFSLSGERAYVQTPQLHSLTAPAF